MKRDMSANIAGVAGGLAMLGVTIASRRLGISYGDHLAEDTTETVLQAVNAETEVTETQEQALGIGTHLGFAMSSAMLYSRFRHFINLPGAVVGALFGLALWGLTVAGIAPMLGIRKAPWNQDEGKAVTTIIGHLVFGAVVGLLYDQLVADEEVEQ